MQTLFRSYPSPLRIIRAFAILMIVLLQPGPSQAEVRNLASEVALSQSGLIPAILYVTYDQHIHEIALKGTWQDRDLTVAAGAPVAYPYSRPMAYQRSDGVSMIIYRGEDSHIHSLSLDLQRQGNTWQEVWHWADLTNLIGSPLAACDPYGYVRSDGLSTVVYTAGNGHIYELGLGKDYLYWMDLTAFSGAPTAVSCPHTYVRADGINAVVFAGLAGDHIYELRLDNGWKWADLTDLAGAPDAISFIDPTAYVRSDRISTVNYLGVDKHLHELRLEGGWKWADLTALSGAPEPDSTPFGYVRSDGINAIVYHVVHPDGARVYELRLDNGWHYDELTSASNAVLGGDPPTGYVRADGISAVVYGGIDQHIHEISLQTTWRWADLTNLAGAPIAAGNPRPYNRNAVACVYLPLIARQ